MIEDNVGTPRSLSINGVGYRVAADADYNASLSLITSEYLPTTGAALLQVTRKNPMITGIPLRVTPSEMDTLNQIAADGEPAQFAITEASGTVIAGTVTIAGDRERSSATGTYTIDIQFAGRPTIIPRGV